MQLRLDQPDLIDARARRLRFGDAQGPRITLLKARGARYDGGADRFRKHPEEGLQPNSLAKRVTAN